MAKVANKKQTKYGKFIELYNAGNTDIQFLAEELSTTEGTIKAYTSKARKNGLIQKIENKYDRFIELYNAGNTDIQLLEKELGITIKTIKKYIFRARRDALIQGKETKYDRLIKLYNEGNTDVQFLVKELSTTEGTIRGYIFKARRDGKIRGGRIRKRNIHNNENNGKYFNNDLSLNKEELEKKIKEMLKTMYPLEIASALNIKPLVVFDILDSMSENERKEIQKSFIRNRKSLCYQISKLKSEKSITSNQALKELEKKFEFTPNQLGYLFQVADIYYILGDERNCIRSINTIIRDDEGELKERAIQVRERLLLEFKAKKIRKDVKTRERQGKTISYNELAKQYSVREVFIIGLIGTEKDDLQFER